jgi:hypothetical protein
VRYETLMDRGGCASEFILLKVSKLKPRRIERKFQEFLFIFPQNEGDENLKAIELKTEQRK